MFYGTATIPPPPSPPPRELLLPQDIPEMHSRGVGQLGGGGGNAGQKVKSQQGMECKCTTGYMENTVRADTHKGSCRKTGNYSETKGDGKLKTVRIEKGWGSNTQSVTKFGL